MPPAKPRFSIKPARQVESRCVMKFISNFVDSSENTAKTYRIRLYTFIDFAKDVDALIDELKAGKRNIYDTMSDYVHFLAAEKKVSSNYIHDCVKTARQLLEFNDCDISDTKFRSKVKLPRKVRKEKEAIDKDDVRAILHAADDIAIKTYLLTLAATGMRSVEALSIRYCDLRLDENPARVYIRGEFTKTKADRFVFLTNELVRQLKDYIAFKHRRRRFHWTDAKGQVHDRILTPQIREEELIFQPYRRDDSPVAPATPKGLYYTYAKHSNAMLDRIGWDKRESHSGFRRITRHTFRRFVRSTISDLGYSDYGEWYIGHAGSTYYRKKDSEKVEIFRKIEPYLTFLDVAQLEARGADIQTQLQQEREQRISLQEQMQIMARAMAAPDEKTRQRELAKLDRMGFFETKKFD